MMYGWASTLLEKRNQAKQVMKHKGLSTSFRFTEKQSKAIDELCESLKEKKVDVVKLALSLLCKKQGIYWPKNVE